MTCPGIQRRSTTRPASVHGVSASLQPCWLRTHNNGQDRFGWPAPIADTFPSVSPCSVVVSTCFFSTKSPMAFWPPLTVICLLTMAQSPGVASRHMQGPAIAPYGSGTLDFRLLPRDAPTFWITKNAGLPSLFVLCSPLYSFILLQQFTDSPLPFGNSLGVFPQSM